MLLSVEVALLRDALCRSTLEIRYTQQGSMYDVWVAPLGEHGMSDQALGNAHPASSWHPLTPSRFAFHCVIGDWTKQAQSSSSTVALRTLSRNELLRSSYCSTLRDWQQLATTDRSPPC